MTSGTGAFNFVNVQPGDYTVRVSLSGFKESVVTGVPVSPNSASQINLTVEVGERPAAAAITKGLIDGFHLTIAAADVLD